MAKLALVKCCICNERDIDRNVLVEDKDYIRKGTKYYHIKCYEDWKSSKPTTDEEYKGFIYDFLSRDLKVPYDYYMIEAQIKKFTKEHQYTIKGIFFALKYFYEIKGGDWDKGYGGIGIVPFIYNESRAYWILRERESNGIVAQIEQQMKEAEKREVKTVIRQNKKKKKYTMSFDEIERMDNND